MSMVGERSAANTKYYINFEGGGWCTSLDDCYDRGYGKGRRKGSSVGLPDPFNLIELMDSWGNWYFSNRTDDGQGHSLNPVMHDWNMLQVLYCDGASWTGSNVSTTTHKGKQLHFRGKNNLDALIEDLLSNKGMNRATEVVISGGSAGALAVYLHADAIRAKLPTSAKVVALPDDGFFMDNSYSEANGWATLQRWVFEAQNSTAGLSKSCLDMYNPKGEAWKCFFAQYAAPLIEVPLFALQPMYDAYQVSAELGSKEPAAVNAYGANLTNTLKAAVLAKSENGAYLDGCLHHGGGWPAMQAQAEDKSWASPIDAFTQWYTAIGGSDASNASTTKTARAGGAQRYWQTPSSGLLPNGRPATDFPCRACCPCRPNRTSGNFAEGCKL